MDPVFNLRQVTKSQRQTNKITARNIKVNFDDVIKAGEGGIRTHGTVKFF